MLSKQVTTNRLLRAIVDRVVQELGAERGTLFLVDASKDSHFFPGVDEPAGYTTRNSIRWADPNRRGQLTTRSISDRSFFSFVT